MSEYAEYKFSAMNKVLNALLSAGVKQNETSTSAFSISSQGRNIITGFTATNSIQVESSHINDTAKWIDTAIAGEANNVNNVVFTISDKKLEETKNLLIKEAISNARSKADIAASTLGLKVVGVKSASVNEFDTSPPPPLLAAQPYTTAGAAKAATPIISGQEQVSINVSVVYLFTLPPNFLYRPFWYRSGFDYQIYRYATHSSLQVM